MERLQIKYLASYCLVILNPSASLTASAIRFIGILFFILDSIISDMKSKPTTVFGRKSFSGSKPTIVAKEFSICRILFRFLLSPVCRFLFLNFFINRNISCNFNLCCIGHYSAVGTFFPAFKYILFPVSFNLLRNFG